MTKRNDVRRVVDDKRSARNRTGEVIELVARRVLDAVANSRLPELRIPSRTLSNVSYDRDLGHFVLGDKVKTRGLGPRSVKAFAQTMRLLAFSKELVDARDYATKREAYYVAKSWGDCRFAEQSSSDAILDDIEALASHADVTREALGFYPESHGGSVAGRLVIEDAAPDRPAARVDLTALGTGAYTVPRSLEHLSFQSDAELVLVVETGGMFQRLHNHRFWDTHPSILVEMAGVPTRATRRFVRKLADDLAIPVYVFTDCDPYGFANIYRTLKAGSGNAAHMSHLYSVPSARFLGVTPQDIVDFGLEDATHPLEASDIKRAHDALDHDPFFLAHPEWRRAIQQQLDMGVRAEQQALAKWGLDFVITKYLPEKLAHPETFLP